MLDRVREKREQIHRLASSHRGRCVYIFGSCARKEERADSDIDILVDFAPGATLFGMADLQDDLQRLLGRAVDLVATQALKDDSFGRRVQREMVLI